jgi:hypothetical protein
MTPAGVAAYRTRRISIFYDASVPLELPVAIAQEPGEILKKSSKALTRRMGDWLIKESRPTLAGVFKRTFKPDRYRRAWIAAWYLRSHDVPVPKPLAYLERRIYRVVLGDVYVSEYLWGHVSVEDYARAVIGPHPVHENALAFLTALAKAVKRIENAGAYHADLSGKNILTQDGSQFYTIDLDAVSLGTPYSDEARLKNHVQLYDSFCDFWPDDVLIPFIASMLPDPDRVEPWMHRVWKGQRDRRRRTEEIWRRNGRSPQRMYQP